MTETNPPQTVKPLGSFYEFFAGGGMARVGLGDNWQCVFANDIDGKKASAYAENWGPDELELADVSSFSADDLPGETDLAWASFPCQDLSLAGSGAGLNGTRSGTFWPFWTLMKELARQSRAPRLVVLENVCGALTSHGGRDFRLIVDAIQQENYRLGALVIDAVRFVPQSRPRLFLIAIRSDLPIPASLTSAGPMPEWSPEALVKAYKSLNTGQRANWVWWRMPVPLVRAKDFSELIDDHPDGVRWHTIAETKRLLDLMSPLNRAKVNRARGAMPRKVGTIYKRTRNSVQRAEVRFDGIAGCLRTPAGGSSRQLVLMVEGKDVRSRLLSTREAARLMGLPENYSLPSNYNDAYHLLGDGLVVPVVSWIEMHLLSPMVREFSAQERSESTPSQIASSLAHA